MAILFLHGSLRRVVTTGIAYAATFIATYNITDAAQKQALFDLESDLKSAGLLSNVTRDASVLEALWPIVGGNSQAHSGNFVNPTRNLLGFNGSPQHSGNGVLFNGQNQYAVMGGYTAPSLGNTASMGMYCRQILGGQYHMGSYGGGGKYFTIYQQGNTFLGGIYADEVQADLSQQGNALGFRAINRSSNTQASILLGKGPAQIFSLAASLPPPASQLILGGLGNNGSPSNFSSIEATSVFLAPGLTAAQLLALRAAINRFNTTLNRAV